MTRGTDRRLWQLGIALAFAAASCEKFRGQSLSATQDVPNLQLVEGTRDHDGLNDCITSVRVSRQ